MAVFNGLRLVSLAVLVLASQLDSASAAARVYSISASRLNSEHPGNEQDAYIKVLCGSIFGGQTQYRLDTAYPTWYAEFNFPYCKYGEKLTLEVWDSDPYYDDHLCTCYTYLKYGVFEMSCRCYGGTLVFHLEVK
ncbi:hypothetical protein F2P79_009559 [Pimephales promelas]|nr:hypothetical protein F2P79_009559 [Pimephales promelas]